MAESALEWIAVVTIGLVAYSYLVYPFLLSAIAALVQLVRDVTYVLRKSDRRNKRSIALPPVAIVISAHNEERHIRDRVENLLALDYPAHLLRAYIGSDGSADRTGRILGEFTDARLHAFVFEHNRGKASVLNDLLTRVTEPIVVFSDANVFFEADAVLALVAHFSDEQVGGVSGELRLAGAGGDNQDSLYWRVEQFLKFFEARINGLLGANGAIYAIRRDLWKPLCADTICDDFCVAMNVAAAGRRLVYEPSARAHEDTPASIGDEYKRRVRIGIGNFQALLRHPEYLFRTSAGTAFAYLSHKVIRWLAPHLLAIGLLASCVVATASTAWAAFAAAQAGLYAIAAWTYRRSVGGSALPAALRIPAFLFAINWAFLVASYKFATGQYGGSWTRTRR